MNLESVALKHKIGKLRLRKILIENGIELRKRGGQVNSGKNRLIWDYETCKEESRKYSSKTEMQRLNGSAYNASLRYGWLDEFFPVAKKEEKEKINWQEEFSRRVRERHGDKFDITNSVYVNSKTPVVAVCKYHGEFSALPSAYYNGIACPGCVKEHARNIKMLSMDEFVKKFYDRFGKIITFDKSVYVDYSTPITATCPIHGDFIRTPNKLMEGFCCPECAKKREHDRLTLTQEEFLSRIEEQFGDLYDTSLALYVSAKTPVSMICREHGIFKQTPEMLFNGYGCPHCSNQTSMQEREIIDFVKGLVGNDNVKIKDREVLEGKEIDILIPSKKVGIEYNGNFWHSETKGKDRNYHVNKTKLAESKGYRLIQIFSDEYKDSKELVLDKIRHTLGCDSKKPIIGARKCIIREINNGIAREFMNKFHLQGFSNSTVYYGGYYNDKLMAVMSFLRCGNDEWNLTRFTTDINYSIPGIASKMFKYFINNNEVNTVKSFLDRRWGTVGNNVYDKLGFVIDKVERPDYRYLVDGKRIHKFNFRKKALSKKYNLPMSMTESEMTDKIGISRIWDCGLIKYVYYNQH